eukprot:Nitzschia sp. Nitz4//scaffold4_size323378//291957//292643//NITZ4_000713-RA/size323378-processed-gene-0.230-mRNA-1//-1//CDS//3329553558//7762//frame0
MSATKSDEAKASEDDAFTTFFRKASNTMSGTTSESSAHGDNTDIFSSFSSLFSSGTSTTEDASPKINVAQDFQRFIQESSTKDLVLVLLVLIGGYAVIKSILSAVFSFGIVLFPILYVYCLQTCPEEGSFDARREFKRVLRGHHLPEDHPDKPKGYFERMMAKANAAIKVESATLAGCAQTTNKYWNIFVIVNLKVPTEHIQLYWIGIAGNWYYITTRPFELGSKKKN